MTAAEADTDDSIKRKTFPFRLMTNYKDKEKKTQIDLIVIPYPAMNDNSINQEHACVKSLALS